MFSWLIVMREFDCFDLWRIPGIISEKKGLALSICVSITLFRKFDCFLMVLHEFNLA